jgi:hypothetical protein
MSTLLTRAIQIVLVVAIVVAGIRFGPNLYARFFGGANIQWISERFSEVLKEKNELVVYEVTLTGQETVSQSAFLIGTVQRVFMPYSYSIRYLVDLSQSEVSVADGAIEVRITPPRADYGELTVNESEITKWDLLYRLTPERIVGIQSEMKARLFDECAKNPEYLSSAWDSAEKSIAALFSSVLDELNRDVSFDVHVRSMEI